MDSFLNSKDGQILYNVRHLSIIHFPTHQVLFYKLSGYMEGPDAMDFFEKMLKALEQTRVRFIIADLTDFKGCHLNLAKYANEVWIPKVADKGVTHFAMNTPTSEFGAFTTKIAAGPIAQSLVTFRVFNDLNKAFPWFKEQANGF